MHNLAPKMEKHHATLQKLLGAMKFRVQGLIPGIPELVRAQHPYIRFRAHIGLYEGAISRFGYPL